MDRARKACLALGLLGLAVLLLAVGCQEAADRIDHDSPYDLSVAPVLTESPPEATPSARQRDIVASPSSAQRRGDARPRIDESPRETEAVPERLASVVASLEGLPTQPADREVSEQPPVAGPVPAAADADATAVESAPDDTRAQPVFRTSGRPPPGFEAFYEPQRTLVDIHYGGTFLLSTAATYDLDHITFEQPETIVGAIPDLIGPDAVLSALSGKLDTHESELCIRPGQEDCGSLDPPIAAVLFDPSQFRATVFINPELLATRGPQLSRYLPRSDAGFSILQNVLANISGSSTSSDSYNIASITSLGYRETHAEMFSSYGADDRFTIDSLSARREFEGAALQGGLYRSRSQSLGFVNERDLYGFRYGRSLNTRADRAFADGVPLEVFLPSRSRVEIIKDGRLLSTRLYDAGNRVLDTSMLPEGAYDITLRIRESDGTERIEERFFVKTTRLPPADEPLYFFELGRIADRNTRSTLPEDTGDWLARTGYTMRIGDDSGVDLGLAASSGEQLLEAGYFRITRIAEVQASAFVGSSDVRGFAAVSRMQFGNLRLSADYRRVDTGDITDSRRSLVGTGFEQFGINLRTPFAGGSFGASVRVANRDGDRRRDSQNVNWERTVLRTMNGSVRFTADVTRQEGDWLGLVGVRLDLRGDGYTGNFSPRARWDRRDGSHDFDQQTSGRMAWQRFDEAGTRLLGAVSGSSGPDEERIGVEGEMQGRLGQLRADLDQNFGNDDRTTWTGTLNTSLLSDGSRIAMGGRDQAQAAALVDIEGDVSDARFEVRVDGFNRGVAPVGSVTPVHLRPWETYEIRLRPVGAPLLSFEDRVERITLYPGNVVHLNWRVAEMVVLFGRLLDPEGEALEGLRMEGAQGLAVTDIGGLFQAEVFRPETGNEVELAVTQNGRSCSVRISIDDLEVRNGIARAGTRRCQWQ